MRKLQSIMLLIGLTCLVYIPNQGWSESDEELLNFLIAQNEAAKEKASSVSYKIDWDNESDLEEGHRVDKGHGEVKLDGQKIWSTFERKASIPATGWEQDQSGRVVLNDSYFGYWPIIGNHDVYRNDHQSIAEMSEDSRLQLSLNTPPEFLYLCFGGGHRPLRDTIKMHPGFYTWKVKTTNVDGGKMYNIERYNPKKTGEPEKPETVWMVDPNSGFTIVQILAYAHTGELFLDYKLGMEQVAKDIWFPVTFEQKRYETMEGAPGSTKLIGHLKARMTDIQIKPPLPKEQFELESMEIPKEEKKHKILRTRLDGKIEAWIYKKGVIIPEGMANIAQVTEEDMLKNLQHMTASRPAKENLTTSSPAASAPVARKVVEERPQESNHKLFIVLAMVGIAVVGGGFAFYKKPRKRL